MLLYLDYYELIDLYDAVKSYNAKYKRFQNLLSKLEREKNYYESICN